MTKQITETIHKVATAVAVGAALGLFNEYVEVQKKLASLEAEIKRANDHSEIVLAEINRIHPRR